MPEDHITQSQRVENDKNQQQERGTTVQHGSKTEEDTWSRAATKGSQNDGSIESDWVGDNHPKRAVDGMGDVSTISTSIQRWLDQLPSEEPWTPLRQDSTKSSTESTPSSSSMD